MGRVKVGKLEVYPADPELRLPAMVMRLPEGRKTTPDVIALQPKEIPWLIEQLQALLGKGR